MDSDKKLYFEGMLRSKLNEMRGLPIDSIFPKDNFKDPSKDEADSASEIIQGQIDLALSNNHRKQILALQSAIARLSTGNFGICERCEKPIPEKRLMARPESIYCIKCQEEADREMMI